MRAGMVAVLALAGGLASALAEAALPLTHSPLLAFWSAPSVTAPKDWSLDPASWRGIAGLTSRLAYSGLWWPLLVRVFSGLLLGAAALAVLHPAAYERPASYYLSPFRRSIAYLSALIIGFAIPVAVGILGQALSPGAMFGQPDPGAAIRLGLVFVAFASPLWMIAGPGLLNLRAVVRLVHGAVVGVSAWAACSLGVLLAAGGYDVVELLAVGPVFAPVDAARGSPGATYGWILASTGVVGALALALAGAVAVVGAPQSVGPASRAGAALAAALTLLLLLLAGWLTAASARNRIGAAAPDVVAELGLRTDGPARPIVLLMGAGRAGLRVPRRQVLQPHQLAADCAPLPEHRDRSLPAASEENLALIDAWLASHPDEVSGLAARVLGCRAGILSRLFRAEDARRQIFGDARPARVGFFGFRFAVQSVVDLSGDPSVAEHARALEDSTRFVLSPAMADSLRERRARTQAVGAVAGRLMAPAAEAWRLALTAAPPAGTNPWLVAPRSDGLALRYVLRAASPGPEGAFRFDSVVSGAYFLALLAPEGTDPVRLAALSVSGDPGQFVVPAGGRRDLGIIRISY
jgi:hypothetical protein